jgi:hypothetical protein
LALRQNHLAYLPQPPQTGSGIDHSAFLRDTTEVSPLTAALFSGTLTKLPSTSDKPDVLIGDDWIRMEVPQEKNNPNPKSAPHSPSVATQLLGLHTALHAMETDAFALMRARQFQGANTAMRDALVPKVVALLERDAYDVEMIALEREVAMGVEVGVEDAEKDVDAVREEKEEVESEEDEEERVLYEENQRMLARVVSEWREARDAGAG